MKPKISQHLMETVEFLFHARVRDTNGEYAEEDHQTFCNQMIAGFKEGVLNLSCQSIGMTVLTQLTKIMRAYPYFHAFNLYGNLIRDHGILSVYQLMITNQKITVLDIGCNDLTNQSQKTIFDIITETSVRSLNLGIKGQPMYINKFSIPLLVEILNYIHEVERIECLGLNGVCMSKRQGAKLLSMADILASYISQDQVLKSLSIADCGFQNTDMDLVTEGLLQNDRLYFLDMHRSALDDYHGVNFMSRIYMMKRLRYLNISRCSLNEEAGMALAESLRNGLGICVLDISDNQIGTKGFCEILSVLLDSDTLTELDASTNGFGEECSDLLEAVISKNQVLCYLDISNNSIGDQSAFAVANSISSNDALTYLNMSSCKISDQGAVAIATALETNNTLKTFLFYDNFLSRECGYELMEHLRKNEFIERIDLTASQIDHFVITGAQDICKRNKQICKNQRLQPLKQELIRLSIQRTKMPEAKDKLKKIDGELRKIQDEIDNTTEKYNDFVSKSNDRITELSKSIKGVNELIMDEKKAMMNMNVEDEKVKLSLNVRYEETQKSIHLGEEECIRIEKATEVMEEKIGEISKKAEEEREEILKKIAEYQAMMEAANAAKESEETVMGYEVPVDALKEDKDTVFLLDQLEAMQNMESKKIRGKKSRASLKSGSKASLKSSSRASLKSSSRASLKSITEMNSLASIAKQDSFEKMEDMIDTIQEVVINKDDKNLLTAGQMTSRTNDSNITTIAQAGDLI